MPPILSNECWNSSLKPFWLANLGPEPHFFWLDMDGIFHNIQTYKEKKILSVFNVRFNGKKLILSKRKNFEESCGQH